MCPQTPASVFVCGRGMVVCCRWESLSLSVGCVLRESRVGAAWPGGAGPVPPSGSSERQRELRRRSRHLPSSQDRLWLSCCTWVHLAGVRGPQAHRQGRCGVLSSRRSPGQSPPGEGCVGLSRNPAGTPRPALSGVPAVTCHMGLGGPLTEPAALYSQLEGWGAGDRGLYRHRWCGDGSEVPRRTAA